MPTLVICSGFIDSDIRVANVGTPPKKVAEFRVNDGAGWTSVKAWEQIADKVPPKGSHVVVHGRLSTRSYENKDGVKVWITEVVANMIDQVSGPATDRPAPPAQQSDAGSLFDD